MSSNILTVMTDQNEVFYSGLEKDYLLEKINFFKDLKITGIGSFYNNFVIIAGNRVFIREPLEEEENIKYYGDLGLYEIDSSYFKVTGFESIGGKFQNVLAVSK